MPGRIQRSGNVIPGPRTPGAPTPLSPPTAAQTLTVVKYPGAIDDVGTGKTLSFADDATVLVALFTNFLGAIVQAIQAELGAIATKGTDPNTWVAGHKNLRDLLDQISLATTANPGKLVGAKRFSLTKSGWSGQQNTTVDTGFRPTGAATPAAWCYLFQANRTLAEALTGPTIVRADSFWITPFGTTVFVRMAAAKLGNTNPGTGGAPTSLATFTVEGILFFMPEGHPDR